MHDKWLRCIYIHDTWSIWVGVCVELAFKLLFYSNFNVHGDSQHFYSLKPIVFGIDFRIFFLICSSMHNIMVQCTDIACQNPKFRISIVHTHTNPLDFFEQTFWKTPNFRNDWHSFCRSLHWISPNFRNVLSHNDSIEY